MNETLRCEFCLKIFSCRKTLVKHLKTAMFCLVKRQTSLEIQCNCGRKFADDVQFQEHQCTCIIFKNDMMNRMQNEMQNFERNKHKITSGEQCLDIRERSLVSDSRKGRHETYLENEVDLQFYVSSRSSLRVPRSAPPPSAEQRAPSQSEGRRGGQRPGDCAHFDEKAKHLSNLDVEKGHQVRDQGTRSEVGLANFFVDRVATNEKGEVGI
jgi:hypothetical protein